MREKARGSFRARALLLGAGFAIVGALALAGLRSGGPARPALDANVPVITDGDALPAPLLTGPVSRQRQPVQISPEFASTLRKRASLAEMSPAAEKALAHHRVFSEDTPEGPRFRGIDYHARVHAGGFHFRAHDLQLDFHATRLEQGAEAVTIGRGSPTHPQDHVAQVVRKQVVEEYVFENDRVEQLFRVPQPISTGELRVRIAVQSSLQGGSLQAVPRRSGGWKDTTLWNGGLVFKDASGRTRATYHSAKAVDAAGREQDIEPKVENGDIVLAVADTFMARAAYPVVIDPWLQLENSASGGGITNNARVSEGVSVALDGSGNPFVAWSDDSSGNFDIYMRYFNGFSWKDLGGSTLPGGISNNAGKSSHPSITIGINGEPMIAWDDETSGDYEIFFKKWDGISSLSWIELKGSAAAGGVSRRSGQSLYPSVGTVFVNRELVGLPDEQKEVPVIAWQQDANGASEIFVMLYFPGDADSDESWYSFFNINISGTPARVSERPRLVMDPFQRPFVAWSDTANGNYEIYLRGFFHDPLFPMTTLFGGQSTLLLLVDNGDDVFRSAIVGYLSDTGTFEFGSWTAVSGSGAGGGASGPGGASPGLSLYPSLAIDFGNSDLYLAWQESPGALASPTDIFLRRSVNGGPVTFPLTAPDAADYGAWNPMAGAGTLNVSTTGRAVNPGMGLQFSVPGSAVAVPFVAWQDDTAAAGPPAIDQPEILVRQFNGAAWVNVGDAGSTFATGGISQTANLSYFPFLASNGGGEPVVAWMDGALGAFDIYLRKFYIVRAILLDQFDALGAPLLVGANTPLTTVQLRGNVTAESLAIPTASGVRMQVEVRPLGTPFIGQATLESALVGPGGPVPPGTGTTVTIFFDGAPNVQYVWQARAVDQIGRAGPWEPFGSNSNSAVDFEIRQVIPTPAPTNMDQLRGSHITFDAASIIPLGQTIAQSTVTLVGTVTRPDAATPVRFEVEVIPIASLFSGTPTAQGAFITTQSAQVLLVHPTLPDGSYHWRARSVPQTGAPSGWLSFGGNPDGQADFVILSPIPTTLEQRRVGTTTIIPTGATISDQGVTFAGTVTSPVVGETVRLQVEVIPISAPFSGTFTVESGNLPSGSVATVDSGFLPFESYHWRARSATAGGTLSNWVSFGTNADGQTDFRIFIAPIPTAPDGKDKCGLMGWEALALIALLAGLRRRTR